MRPVKPRATAERKSTSDVLAMIRILSLLAALTFVGFVPACGQESPISRAQSSEMNKPHPDWHPQRGESGATVNYRAPGGNKATVSAFPIVALDGASGGIFSQTVEDDPREVLEYALSVFALDFPEVAGEETIGDDFAIWGTATGASGEEIFGLRLQPTDTPPSIAMLRNGSSAGEAQTLITRYRWPMARSAGAVSTRPSAETLPALQASASAYPRPRRADGEMVFPGWSKRENSTRREAAEGDRSAPRFVRFTYSGLGDRPERALSRALEDMDVKRARMTDLETLEISKQIVGTGTWVAAGTTQLGSEDAMVFLHIFNPTDQNDVAVVEFFEAPKTVYEGWGGVALMLELQGVLKSTEQIPPEYRAAVAAASPDAQVEVFEEAYNRRMIDLFKGTMAAKAGTTMMMMELNYDLLLGDDITSPMIAD